MQVKFVGKNRAIQLVHYTGPRQVKPPAIPTHKMHAGINYTDTCAQQASLVAAEQADTQWFNSLSQEQEAM